jgi:DNA-directed RNA polymerase specialized sigma24 family protein
MARASGIIDWEKLSKYENLDEVIRILPPDHVIEVLGDDQTAQILTDRALAKGAAGKLVEAMLARLPVEQRQEILQRQLQQDNPKQPPSDQPPDSGEGDK